VRGSESRTRATVGAFRVVSSRHLRDACVGSLVSATAFAYAPERQVHDGGQTVTPNDSNEPRRPARGGQERRLHLKVIRPCLPRRSPRHERSFLAHDNE
jgi:hypothetical protein